jgi:microcystin-dependent protein
MYGGNGQTNFALPDLRGRVPAHVGGSFATQGERAGEAVHTLTIQELPTHPHFLNASSANANTPVPGNDLMAGANNAYVNPAAGSLTTLQPATVSNVGGSQPHENRQPLLTLNMIVALQGIFPSRN